MGGYGYSIRNGGANRCSGVRGNCRQLKVEIVASRNTGLYRKVLNRVHCWIIGVGASNQSSVQVPGVFAERRRHHASGHT